MYPLVATSTQQYDVGGIKTESFATRPRLNVVDVQATPSAITCSTPSTRIVIAFKYLSEKFLSLSPHVFTLTFGRAATYEGGAILPSPVKHPIALSAKPRFRDTCLFAQPLARFVRVLLAEKGVGVRPANHVIVIAFQVFTAGPGWNIKVSQLFINALWVAFDYSADVISGKTFNNVLLIKPIAVKVRGFIHMVIVPPYWGLSNVLR